MDPMLEKIIKFKHWVDTCPDSFIDSFIPLAYPSYENPSKIALDAQKRIISQLAWWLEHGDEYLDECVEHAWKNKKA